MHFGALLRECCCARLKLLKLLPDLETSGANLLGLHIRNLLAIAMFVVAMLTGVRNDTSCVDDLGP